MSKSAKHVWVIVVTRKNISLNRSHSMVLSYATQKEARSNYLWYKNLYFGLWTFEVTSPKKYVLA